VAQTALHMADALGGKAGDYTEIVYQKLMGRKRDGTPNVPASGNNKFNYKGDPQGQACPLHAHIRLAHPRADRIGAARPPRIMRRGMSYGPDGSAGAEKDRGIMFMAYNTSISEQFETVQRWLSGGNSTGSTSSESCPIVGVPDNGFPRFFRFEHDDGKKGPMAFRVRMEDPKPLFEDPAPVTQLEWGMYLFAPSMSALAKLQAVASGAAAMPTVSPAPWQVARGLALIQSLDGILAAQGPCVAAKAWKAVIEDPDSIDRLDSAALWAAIRQEFGGVLKTPYGTLVASREMTNVIP
jgi:hypothetical protein